MSSMDRLATKTVLYQPRQSLLLSTRHRELTMLGALVSMSLLGACESGGPTAPPRSTDSAAPSSSMLTESKSAPRPGGTTAPTGSPSSIDDRRPAAIWNEVVVEWSELRPRLAERSGGVVLEEYLLDRRLDQVLRERNITLSAEQIANEERILLDALDPSSARSAELLGELRQAQGLGSKRWADLLRRNAALRALIAGEVRR